MPTPNQKADVRPISFRLHDTTGTAAPVDVKLVIRPEDLTRTDTSRLSVQQTLGGAWGDNFGIGIPVVQISGHTGWGAGDRPNGLLEFENLYKQVFKEWHRLRDEALTNGLDPDKVKLIFSDVLDDFTWVVAPNNFILKRNRARPLLSQYQITLTWLADTTALPRDNYLPSFDTPLNGISVSGLASLQSSLDKIKAFLLSGASAFLGPLKAGFDALTGLTSDALAAVKTVTGWVEGLTGGVAMQLLSVAQSLTAAATNVAAMITSVYSLPLRIKAQFQQVFAAFQNAMCVLQNATKKLNLPNYDDLYGSSTCSSTAGGKPLSIYDAPNANPFTALFPAQSQSVSVSSGAAGALVTVSKADPVLAPLSVGSLQQALLTIKSGVVLAAA